MMYWFIMLIGIVSVISSLLGIVLAYNKNKIFIILLLITFLASLSMIYLDYINIYTWIIKEDWTALSDVVPTTKKIFLYYLIYSFSINVISTLLYLRKLNEG